MVDDGSKTGTVKYACEGYGEEEEYEHVTGGTGPGPCADGL